MLFCQHLPAAQGKPGRLGLCLHLRPGCKEEAVHPLLLLVFVGASWETLLLRLIIKLLEYSFKRCSEIAAKAQEQLLKSFRAAQSQCLVLGVVLKVGLQLRVKAVILTLGP